ncbi:MAG: PEGA domain-containing protein [Candidatus Dojkabacteria bacterium]|uniref:PEGA domain-containing protein n=1 Tax=Candidatus Dojkabacteria bacterium TaxID=2099670 RepID=A0A952DV03_9BACT|nr:PEGA domain-containing protein [Candidatus Dojkabacteria bacterium]WKZ27886.1 MAG: PEGA domain-containing protein [Candidatus Dojkabacteria bacterium]
MLKKLLAVIILIIILAALAFWSPWQKWDLSFSRLLGIDAREEFAALKVKSLAGDLDVYLDGELVGQVSAEEDFLEVFPIDPGEHTVKLVRNSTISYPEVIKKLNFEPAVDVIIGYEIGPNEAFSEGHILYARRSYTANENPLLEIYSVPEAVRVLLNGEEIGQTPLRSISLPLDTKHKLRFEKDGYDSLEIEILPDNQSDREKLKNTVLTLEVNLFAQPIPIVEQ